MNPLGGNNHVPVPAVNPMANQIMGAIQFARSFSSPEEYMRQLQVNNPQMFRTIMDLQNKVKDPMAYARKVLSEQGINPEQIAGMLQQIR